MTVRSNSDHSYLYTPSSIQRFLSQNKEHVKLLFYPFAHCQFILQITYHKQKQYTLRWYSDSNNKEDCFVIKKTTQSQQAKSQKIINGKYAKSDFFFIGFIFCTLIARLQLRNRTWKSCQCHKCKKKTVHR